MTDTSWYLRHYGEDVAMGTTRACLYSLDASWNGQPLYAFSVSLCQPLHRMRIFMKTCFSTYQLFPAVSLDWYNGPDAS